MKLFSCSILFMLLCVLSHDSSATKKILKKSTTLSNFFITIPFNIPKAWGILKDIHSLWDDLLKEPDLTITSAIFKSTEQEIRRRFLEVTSKVSALEREVRENSESITIALRQAFPKILKLEINLHDLTLIINQINFAQEQMRNYLIQGYENSTTEVKEIPNSGMEFATTSNLNLTSKVLAFDGMISKNVIKRNADHKGVMEHFTLLDFATWAVGHSYYSLTSLLRRMNDMVTGEDTNLFNLVGDLSRESPSNICNLRQSPFQTLYNLYNSIAVAELKGNTILQFSYMLLKMYNKGNFTTEGNIAMQSYEKYSKDKLDIIRDVLSDADRTIYKCDPKQYVENVSYTKLTKLLQGYIENEVNLNPYGGCWQNCAYYKYTEYNGCYKNQFCAVQPKCSGKVLDCKFVDSDMDICTSSVPERRYDWIQYENGKTLGSKGVCQKKNLFKVDSWWRYLFWHCSYCFCLCDDNNQQSDRYFSLRSVTSDIEKNKVVTGVRIVKQNKIIHLQIQQGVLTPLGVVNKTSLSWKPVDNYTIDDDNVENNVDYHTMTWLERALDTDEVFGPPEHVVTGIRFRKIGTHLNLEIRVTPIRFATGEVLSEQHSYWVGNDNTDGTPNNPRTEIKLVNPDIPIRKGPHLINSKHDQFIEFQSTSVETDAAQTTVPFLDSQALTSQGFILSGVGLIHRGKSGSGGFIAPKLISYDFLPHLRFNNQTP